MKRGFQFSYLCLLYRTNVVPYFISQNNLTWTKEMNKIVISGWPYLLTQIHLRLLLGKLTLLSDFDEPNFYFLLEYNMMYYIRSTQLSSAVVNKNKKKKKMPLECFSWIKMLRRWVWSKMPNFGKEIKMFRSGCLRLKAMLVLVASFLLIL